MRTFNLGDQGQPYWWVNDESQAVLNRGYLLTGESVSSAVKRVAVAAATKLNREDLASNFETLISRGWMSLSSPIWANMGTERGLPISCFNVHVPDTVAGIADKHGEVMVQTQTGGGTSGYFGSLRGRGAAITNNGESSGAVSFMKMFDTAMDTVSQGSCYQEGTKVLTDRGFVDFRNVSDKDKLAQVDENNKVTFTLNYELVKNPFNGKLVNIRGKKRKDLVSIGVTPNHRMVIERLTKTKEGKSWKGYTEIVTAENLKLHRDNRMYLSARTSTEGRGLSDAERFMIAFQADGRKEWGTKNARFRFKKERKVARLIQFCNSLELKSKTECKADGSTEVIVYDCAQYKSETLSWVDLSVISEQWCEEFLQEISLWDGSKNKDRCSITYSSTIKSNILMVQAVSTICGKRSRVRVDTEREGNRQDLHVVTISDVNMIQGDSCEIYETDYCGTVYCAVVPKGRLIVEYQGRTLVCGNTRRGAFAAYLDIDHPDIKEFLQIKDIGHPIQNLFYGVCVPDYWLEDMKAGDTEKRELWSKVLESREKKGLPYIFFSDNVNRNKPQVYKDKGYKIESSNLCSEISLPSNEDESFVCCLSSMNLALYDEWKDTDAVQLAIYFLDAVLSEFIDKTTGRKYMEPARRFAQQHRAIGLGVMGWHSYLQSKMIPFDSMTARLHNISIFKNMKLKGEEATKTLAIEYGESPVTEGYGVRNTTLFAIAPTTSSSSILGQVSPGIEPLSANFFKAGLAKGNFMRKNTYLEKLLESKGINNEDTWREIRLNHGSVQDLQGLTSEEKDVFKTFKEISQTEIIYQAAERQDFIDQAQSLNLNIPIAMPVKEVNKLILLAHSLGVKTLYYQRSQSVTKELLSNLSTCKSCEA